MIKAEARLRLAREDEVNTVRRTQETGRRDTKEREETRRGFQRGAYWGAL